MVFLGAQIERWKRHVSANWANFITYDFHCAFYSLLMRSVVSAILHTYQI
jgi:hypothetical protein